MQYTWRHIHDFIQQEGSVSLVTVLEVKGSTPRDAGTRMIIAPSGRFFGTIGGGRLEWEAIVQARKLLEQSKNLCDQHTFPLGPQLGQCCGGSVRVLFECMQRDKLDGVLNLKNEENKGSFQTEAIIHDTFVERSVIAADALRRTFWDGENQLSEQYGQLLTDVRLFGAGHTGKALMLTLAPLPFKVTWYDERDDAFPPNVPTNFKCVITKNIAVSVKEAPNNAFIIALTHSHDSDFEVMLAALNEDRFGYVGVIGSETKAARFKSRLSNAGLSAERVNKMVCPIGYDGIKSKEPASVAVSITAELLMQREKINAA